MIYNEKEPNLDSTQEDFPQLEPWGSGQPHHSSGTSDTPTSRESQPFGNDLSAPTGLYKTISIGRKLSPIVSQAKQSHQNHHRNSIGHDQTTTQNHESRPLTDDIWAERTFTLGWSSQNSPLSTMTYSGQECKEWAHQYDEEYMMDDWWWDWLLKECRNRALVHYGRSQGLGIRQCVQKVQLDQQEMGATTIPRQLGQTCRRRLDALRPAFCGIPNGS